MSKQHPKMYVLDTSVLLSAPAAFRTFAEHEVVIPLVVIKELEGKRHDPELGHTARAALRGLEALRERGDLRDGVEVTDEGGIVRIEINHVDQSGLPDAMASDRTHDTRILAVAKNFANQGRDVTVVSKDMPMRILAETLGLAAEEYRREQVVVDHAYSGVVEVDVEHSLVDALYKDKSVDYPTADDEGLLVNTGAVLLGPNSSALARVGRHKTLDLVAPDLEAFGVRGRSAEQRIALAHLLDDEVGIVSLGGPAGTGKSFLALAAGLEAVLEKKRYERITVFRPLFSVGGQDLGFLPGTAEEKMGPWGAAVFDALRAMTTQDVIDEVLGRGLLEVLPLTHVRGRSLHNSFVILDEAQNLERPVLLTALSRLGENSKVVLSWDAAQRDNLRVGRHDGIAAVVERLKGNPLFAHTTFTKSERGPIAALVTRLLDEMVA
ncbi:PhoH family protein [Nocardioides pakistanensis]